MNRYLTVWGFTIVFPQVPLFKKNVRFSHSFVDSCIWTTCHHKDFTGRVLLWENYISARNNLFHTQRRFFLARYRSPNEPHLLRMVQPIRSPENPGPTVVSIGHLTPWPENPGYRTQVWVNGLWQGPYRNEWSNWSYGGKRKGNEKLKTVLDAFMGH